MAKMKNFAALVISAFCFFSAVMSYSNDLQLQGVDRKCSNIGWHIAVYSSRSFIQCSVLCAADNNCGALNYYDDAAGQTAGNCEILPMAASVKNACIQLAVPRSGWKFYAKEAKAKNKAYFDESSEAICMPYDPYNIVYPIEQMFTCTTSAFIVKQWKRGLRDCRFKKLDNTEYAGNDITSYTTSSLDISFLEAMNNCGNIGCVSVVCRVPACWSKYTNHLTTTPAKNVTDADRFTYWYAECTEEL